MLSFTIGQKVTHPEYGEAVVRFVGENYIGLEFPDGRHALLREEDLDASLKQPSHQPAGKKDKLPWPQSTFVSENEDAEHSPGSHWMPFVDDTLEIVTKLPQFLQESSVKNAVGLTLKPKRALPEEWVQGVTLAWPSSQEGIAITVRITDVSNEVINIFPFTCHGSQHLLHVEKVIVWEDGLTAHIAAGFGDASLVFFDTDFTANRGWYEAGRSQEFLLVGLAYGARPAEIFEMPVTLSPDVVAWQHQLAKQNMSTPMPETEIISLKGMGLLLPHPDGDVDEYNFRGEIMTVNPFAGFIGQNGWRVRIALGMPDSFDLDVYITEKAWQGTAPPQPGEDIEGILWLQGHLWNANYLD